MTEADDGSRRATFYPRGTFSSLMLADFRYVWLSNLSASFAMQMEMVARGWLIYDMTRSPLALTWVMLSTMLPSVLFSLVGGVIADRMGKKRIIITAQMLSTAAMFVLATIVYQGHVTFWHFIWFGLFNGTVMSLSMPARSSIIPELVGRRYVVNAMALQTSTFNLSRILGPTLAGALIAAFAAGDTTSTTGVGIVYYVIGGLFTTSIIATSMMRYRRNPARRRDTSVLTDVGDGFRYMKQERIVVGLLSHGHRPHDVRILLPDAAARLQRGRDRRWPPGSRPDSHRDGRWRAGGFPDARTARRHQQERPRAVRRRLPLGGGAGGFRALHHPRSGRCSWVCSPGCSARSWARST